MTAIITDCCATETLLPVTNNYFPLSSCGFGMRYFIGSF